MKKIFHIVFVLVLFISLNSFSQNLQDQNSNLIESYFQLQSITTEAPAETLLQQNLGSDVIVVQTGNYNNSYILTSAKSKQSVNQIGDHNNYEYYTYYNSSPSEVNTLQLGDNNDIQIFGQNELTKNINIIQQTNNKTLIIKNY